MTYLTGGMSLNTTAKCKNRERESIVFPALYTSAPFCIQMLHAIHYNAVHTKQYNRKQDGISL